MKTSARNKFDGNVTKIDSLGILDNVEITTKDGMVIKAQITDESCKKLELKEGKHCSAIIKAPMVKMSPTGHCRKNAENCYEGTIDQIRSDEHATEVLGTIEKNHHVCAIFANGDKAPDGIKKGDKVKFCFGATSVILVD